MKKHIAIRKNTRIFLLVGAIFVFLLVGLFLRNASIADAAVSEKCWFDSPGEPPYYGPNPNYVSPVNADVCGTIQAEGYGSGFCSGQLHWKSVNGTGWNDPALSALDGYTATLSGGSFNNKQVGLDDGLIITRSELLQNNTYTVSVKKSGSEVTKCSVKISASIAGQPQPGAPQDIIEGVVTPGVFPAPGTYSITVGSGSASVSYKYAPQVPGVFVPSDNILAPRWAGGNSLSTFLGQFHKAIYYVIGHEPGAYGSWNLSDPMSPSINPGPNFLAADEIHGGPIQHLWPHASEGLGAMVAEDVNGDARILNRDGLVEHFASVTVVGYDPVTGYPLLGPMTGITNGPTGFSVEQFFGNKASFGQQIDPNYGVSGGGAQPLAVFSVGDGSFFGYAAGTDKISIFDLSGNGDNWGSANPPYMKGIGSISWPGVSDLHIVQIPASQKQFLVAKLGAGAAVPSWNVAELSSITGKIVRQKPLTFNVPSYSNYLTPSLYAGDDIQSVTVSGKTYFFLVETLKNVTLGSNGLIQSFGTTIIGAYQFDPVNLTVTRKGSIAIPLTGMNGIQYGAFFQLMLSDSGSAPFIAIQKVTTKDVTLSDRLDREGKPLPPVTYTVAEDNGIGMYSTKDLLEKGGDISPQASFTIPAVTKYPLPVGGIIVSEWPLNGFIHKDGTKLYFYLYRNAFYYQGKSDTTFGISKWKDNKSISLSEKTIQKPGYGYWGNPTLRVDRVDVTSITGVSSVVTAPLNPTPTFVPPPSSGTCTATLTFDKTSVVSGGSVTENWTIDGADAGQAYADCGAGETQISAGPKTYVVNNLAKNMTCRVYGKINGIQACTSPSVTVTVTAAGTAPTNTATPPTQNNFGNTNTSLPASVSYNFGTTTLRQGSSGSAVKELQKFLNVSTNSNLVTDGKLGPKTVAVIKIWQANHGLVADGLVGPKTKKAMLASY
jgi:hypothetical protein